MIGNVSPSTIGNVRNKYHIKRPKKYKNTTK